MTKKKKRTRLAIITMLNSNAKHTLAMVELIFNSGEPIKHTFTFCLQLGSNSKPPLSPCGNESTLRFHQFRQLNETRAIIGM